MVCMTIQNIAQHVKVCGELLYQNREQEAYQLLPKLLQILNLFFQQVVLKVQGEDREYVLSLIDEFTTAYQLKDNLELADLLTYNIPEILDIGLSD